MSSGLQVVDQKASIALSQSHDPIGVLDVSVDVSRQSQRDALLTLETVT